MAKSLTHLAAAKTGQPAQDNEVETRHDSNADLIADLEFFRVKRNNEGDVKDVQILQVGFMALLRKLGFRKYELSEGFMIVRIQENIIEPIQLHQLQSFIIRFFHKMDDEVFGDVPKALIMEKLHRTLGTLTTTEKQSLLVDLDDNEVIQVVEDTMTQSYFFYQNGYVEVTKDAVTLHPYKDLPGFVWRDQILKRNFQPMKVAEWETGDFCQFCNNASGNAKELGNKATPARFHSLVTIIGYSLHRYFNTKLRMPIFLDARISDEAEGRSGKSLITKAIRQMLNADPENGKQCIIVDGKSFDPENRFKYEDLDISTRILVIDDVRRGLDIKVFFNSAVDGFMRERKGEKTKQRIWCKAILTLNYTLEIRGGSAKDRVVEFEVADYYSVDRTPEMVHGRWFFRDWDVTEWAKFDNFMVQAVSDYLRAGIIMPDTINLEKRKLIDETSQDFINWMEDLEIEHQKAYGKKELYEKFAEVNDDKRPTRSGYNWLKQKTFTNWLKLFAQYRPELAGFREWRSGGTDFIMYFRNEPVQADFLQEDGNSVSVKIFKEKAKRVVAIESTNADKNDTKIPF